MVHFPVRYYFLAVFLLVTAHFLVTFWRNGGTYPTPEVLSALADKWSLRYPGVGGVDLLHPHPSSTGLKLVDEHTVLPHGYHIPRANATFVMLARNDELKYVIESIKQVEDRFNKHYHYPYVFLNDVPFSEEFKRWTQEIISGKAYYGLVPSDHWNQPEWIDETKAKKMRDMMQAEDVIYGDSVPYRNMCRFNSGFFYKHPLMEQFRYYWRVEPGVTFFCDIHEDPFMFMQENNKTYGFTVSLYEFSATIPSLWAVTKAFIQQNPQYLAEDNAMAFLSDDGGDTYNLCHFWSNFEIADMELWRSPAYSAYFDFLESAGGFYYERWGDAPVHSIGAALFSRKDQIHFFRPIGYRHNPFQHCPQGADHKTGKCWCEEKDNFDYDGYSCTYRYDRLFVP